MNTRLWIIFVVVVAWIGFLIGYSVSALTGVERPAADVAAPAGGYGAAGEAGKPGAGGYGGAKAESKPEPKAGAGAYGGAGKRPKPAAGGYD